MSFPDEVNVFIVPHSRMKDLVLSYKDQLSAADFRNNEALETLLPLLEKTFSEFKTHEHIENQYIMERLKQRLKIMNVTCHAVCNCHKDNDLVEILNMLRDGYTCTTKSISERINFGSQLQMAVSKFTENFIPHMEEEEEVFQPLLMKYFAYEELRSIKEQVIQQHEIWKEKLLAQKVTAEHLLALLSTVASEVSDYCSSYNENQYQDTLQTLVEITCEKIAEQKKEEEEPITGFDQLPEEMVTHIFSYLNPLDRTRCARVCKRFNILVYSPQLWKEIYPTNWAKGFYDFKYHDPYTLAVAGWNRSIRNGTVDDLDDAEEPPSPEALKEIHFYEQFIMHGLVRFGEGVQRLVVAGGLQLTSAMMHSMLMLCPNVSHLDASYTRITDLAFKGLAARDCCSRLEHLDLNACNLITDVGLERLGACFKSEYDTFNKCGSCCKSCKNCPKRAGPIEDMVAISRFDSNGSLSETEPLFSPGLNYLSLSGCTSVTDYGLRALLEVSLLNDNLRFMDLSGCMLLSAGLLNAVAQGSSKLQPQDLYYCNRIENGPYPTEANGCQNLECPIRGCCCFEQC